MRRSEKVPLCETGYETGIVQATEAEETMGVRGSRGEQGVIFAV